MLKQNIRYLRPSNPTPGNPFHRDESIGTQRYIKNDCLKREKERKRSKCPSKREGSVFNLQVFASTENKQKARQKTAKHPFDRQTAAETTRAHRDSRRSGGGNSGLGREGGHGPILGAEPGFRVGAEGPGRRSLPAERETSRARGTAETRIRDLTFQFPGEKGKQKTDPDTVSFPLEALAELRSHGVGIDRRLRNQSRKPQKS